MPIVKHLYKVLVELFLRSCQDISNAISVIMHAR